MLPDDAGPVLLAMARRAISDELAVPAATADGVLAPAADAVPADEPRWLTERAACFVTLTQDGALRGCIGTVDAFRPLGQDVRSNAVAAAVHDRRFPPLRADELDRTRIEVSVLSAPEPLVCADEAAALAALRPGVDGVVLAHGGRRATFLPQVWERLSDPAAFLAALRRKAGLPPDFWADDVALSRYTVTAWEEDR